MVKGIIENTHIISSKVTKFIWLLGYNNFSKMDMYFKTEGVFGSPVFNSFVVIILLFVTRNMTLREVLLYSKLNLNANQ